MRFCVHVMLYNGEYNVVCFLFIEKVFCFGEKKSLTSLVRSAATRWCSFEKHLLTSQRICRFLFDLAAIHRCLKYEAFSIFKKYANIIVNCCVQIKGECRLTSIGVAISINNSKKSHLKNIPLQSQR